MCDVVKLQTPNCQRKWAVVQELVELVSELYLSSVSVFYYVCVGKVADSKLPETVGSRSRARGSGTGQ